MEIKHNDNTYTLDLKKIKFSDVIRYQNILKSGLIVSNNNETNVSTINMTLEYVSNESEILIDIIKKAYTIDFDLDDIDADYMLDLMQFIKGTPFFMKLQVKAV